MNDHCHKKHSSEWELLNGEITTKQPKIGFKDIGGPRVDWHDVDELLLLWLIDSAIPFNSIENPYFKWFLSELSAKYKLPCAKTLSRRLDPLYNQCVDKVPPTPRPIDPLLPNFVPDEEGFARDAQAFRHI
jgi:hypothetical protein